MDVFKILSRGAKKSSNKPLEFKPAPKVQNPQLYHDKGLKRKRPEEEDQFGRDVGKTEDPLLDFFAPRESKEQKPVAQPKPILESPNAKPKPAPSLLDDDEGLFPF
ncbi:hypothetical protein ONZ43_g6867 [Nemania bipapillata]|uniref:Uncharacterized protein n=1 Tax=Nemania bipapillata TaxID=110536 RepID=A0ACC2HVB8_9PEZI|nr:hypothetical protein ONZ43_g6867 [Nemania bipapillata]